MHLRLCSDGWFSDIYFLLSEENIFVCVFFDTLTFLLDENKQKRFQ